MKRSLNVTVLTLTAFILLGTISVMAIERPFALNAKGVATFITDGAGNPIRADVSSSGTATHLGLTTTVGTINFTPDPANPGRLLTHGTGTMTAANGDTVLLELDGALEPSPGSPTATDKFVIRFVGGTGRFAGASGTGTGIVVVNLLTGAFEITMVGDINF
ncbi:MAG TPA: hypothetical protein VFS90_12700 [Pyrinomonadaceae bacterium]|nr:hypothetical protein [Pyrinomonadaceae bacterium]